MSHAKQGRPWLWWVGGGLLTAAALALAGYRIAQDFLPSEAVAHEDAGRTGGAQAVHVEVVYPAKGKVDRSTTQPGTLEPFESAHLYSEVSGYLNSQTVDIGDRVKRGQALATIDVPELEKQVQQRRAALAQAKAKVQQMEAHVDSARAFKEAAEAAVARAQAAAKSAAATLRFREKQLQRMVGLLKEDAIDARLVDEKQEERDAALEATHAGEAAVAAARADVAAATAKIAQAQADVFEAQAEVDVAQAELEQAQVRVHFATIVSPYKGVITQRSRFPGDFVRSAEQGAREPLLTVERIDKFRVVVQIPDRDVPYADPGDKAYVEIDALPGKPFEATVSRIAKSEDPQTRLMHVEIDLPNPSGKLAAGMYGRVTIVLEKSDAFAVPSSCLAGKVENGKADVFVVRGGRVRRVPVEIGPDNGIDVAILKGIRAEDAVVAQPPAGLEDGTPVAVSARAK